MDNSADVRAWEALLASVIAGESSRLKRRKGRDPKSFTISLRDGEGEPNLDYTLTQHGVELMGTGSIPLSHFFRESESEYIPASQLPFVFQWRWDR